MTSLQDVYLIMVHLKKVEGFIVAGGKDRLKIHLYNWKLKIYLMLRMIALNGMIEMICGWVEIEKVNNE